MTDIGYKFKSANGINVTIYKKLNDWGSYLAHLRKIDEKGKVIREGAKIVTEEEIKNKTVDFEEDYIKKYTDLMRKEMKKKEVK